MLGRGMYFVGGESARIRGRLADAVGAAAHTRIDRPAFDVASDHKSGSVYDVYPCTFGGRANMKIKRAPIEHAELAEAEKVAMEGLDGSCCFQRLHYYERSPQFVELVVSGYSENLYEILNADDRTAKLTQYGHQKIIKGMLQGLQQLHDKGKLHGDLRSKNVGIIADDGELITWFNLAAIDHDFNSPFRWCARDLNGFEVLPGRWDTDE